MISSLNINIIIIIIGWFWHYYYWINWSLLFIIIFFIFLCVIKVFWKVASSLGNKNFDYLINKKKKNWWKLWYLNYVNINKFYYNLAVFNTTLSAQISLYLSQLILSRKLKKNSFYSFEDKNLTFKIQTWRSKLFRFLFFFDTRRIKKKKERKEERETHDTP